MPLNVKELDSLLGLASYYKLFRKGVPFFWQQEQKSAFEELTLRLVSAPVLVYQDFKPGAGPIILDTDASQHLGIGAVLS